MISNDSYACKMQALVNYNIETAKNLSAKQEELIFNNETSISDNKLLGQTNVESFVLQDDTLPVFQKTKTAVEGIGTKINSFVEKLLSMQKTNQGASVELDPNGSNNQYFESSVQDGVLSGYTIMVNAGHGGADANGVFDPGAVYNGVEEWTINQDYAEALTEKLLDSGANVLVTQSYYKDLIDVVDNFANQYGEDGNKNLRVISLHSNASTSPEATGVHVYYYSDEPDFQNIATDLTTNLVQSIGENNFPVEQHPYQTNITGESCLDNIPNALVEVGFMSNPEELQQIQTDEYRDALVDSIVEGVISDTQEIK